MALSLYQKWTISPPEIEPFCKSVISRHIWNMLFVKKYYTLVCNLNYMGYKIKLDAVVVSI